MRKFSTKAFLRSDSGKRLKMLVGKHLGILDGMAVQECADGFGEINYRFNGEDCTLYPVMPEWCDDSAQEGQTTISDFLQEKI